jgi:hypothetical protein
LVQEHLNYWIKVPRFLLALSLDTEELRQKIYKADGDAHSWEWLAMVSPCVDVLRNLANRINGDLGARQGKKHSSPNMQKDIDILMASLSKLEVYVEKEGRTLDPDEMPVPDAVSIGLADLAHGSALADFNAQFERNRDRRRLIPISALLGHLQNPVPSPEPLQATPSTDVLHPAPSPDPSRTSFSISPSPLPSPADAVMQNIDLLDAADSSDSDEDSFEEEDKLNTDDLKPMTFPIETEADVAMDMDSVSQYFEDDEYPWEDVLGEYGSESDASADGAEGEADYESS